MNRRKVLIVEDKEYQHDTWRRAIGNKVVIISALSIDEVRKQFASNSDLAAIVMDACVPGDRPTTLPLVREFRESFSGPMIAISSDSDYRRDLVQAGCDHESTKGSMPQKLLDVLCL